MARRLVLAIDCDDVLIPTAQAIIENYNQRFNTKLTLHHMYKPATLESWGTDSDDVAIERVNDFLRSAAHAAIIPSQTAIEAIHELAKNHELHLVTGRANFLEEVTLNTLDQFFKGCFKSIEHTNFIVTSSSTAVRRTKGEVCRTLGAHVLIDDHLQHAQSVLEAELEKVIVFGDYPWNKGVLAEGMIRCVDWSSALNEVRKLAYA
jgi:uncharacterized HAD superfamily protein